MSDFFTRQAERVLGVANAIEPLLASRFAESAFAEGEPGFQEVHAEVERGRETVRASRPAAPRMDPSRTDPPGGSTAGHADPSPSATSSAPVLRRFVDSGDASGAGTPEYGHADPADLSGRDGSHAPDSEWDRDQGSLHQDSPHALLIDQVPATRDAWSPAPVSADPSRERASRAEARSLEPKIPSAPHAGPDRDGATDRASGDDRRGHTSLRPANADGGLLFSADRDREMTAIREDRGRAAETAPDRSAASASENGDLHASGRSESPVANGGSSRDRVDKRESSPERVDARRGAASNDPDPSSTGLLMPIERAGSDRGRGADRNTLDSGSRTAPGSDAAATFQSNTQPESRATSRLMDGESGADPRAPSASLDGGKAVQREDAALLFPPTRRMPRRTADADDGSEGADHPSSTKRSPPAAERKPDAAAKLTLLPPVRNARSQAAAPAPKAVEPERPTVTVSIGRIEVRAAPAPAPEPVVQPAAAGWRAPVLSLNDYLNKGGR
jgi:hypothetical protein